MAIGVMMRIAAGIAALLLAGCGTPVTVKQVPNRPQVSVAPGQQLASVKFDKAIFTLQRGEVIGQYIWNPLMACESHSNNVTWGTGRVVVSDDEVATLFYEAASAARLNVVGNPKTLFESLGSSDVLRPDYLVGARIDQIRMQICNQNWALGPRNVQSGSASIRVTWQLFDVLNRKIVHESVSEGYFQSYEGVANGEARLIYGAIAAAARNFTNDPTLIAGLSLPIDSVADARAIDAPQLLIPRQSPLVEPIARNIDTIRLAAVTMDSGISIGSGFFIAPNLIVTNHHVVEGQKFLKVKLVTGREVLGEVLRVHPHRDVAVVQVESVGVRPMSLRLEPVRLTEEVYAIGSPLDRKYAGTVTKGIVSRYARNPQGMEDIQADVDIHGGNSGGALLDAQGNVVGISYAGLASGRGQTSVGINFFIPITDALQKLNIGVGQPQAGR